ncbi:MAG: hypothetical protein AAFO75_14100, partial [Pseudomonadota bacterium]
TGAVVASSHNEPVRAEKQRIRHKKKQPTLIASLEETKAAVDVQVATTQDPVARDAQRQTLRLAHKGQTNKPIRVARLTPPLPILSPQHRSRRLAGLSTRRKPWAATKPTSGAKNAQGVKVAALNPAPPLPILSPQHRSRRLAGLAPPLPELGPARWRIAAAKLPPPPVAKPIRTAAKQKRLEELDDLAWTLEQVLIERHFRETRKSAIISIDDVPFELQNQREPTDRLRLPVYQARAGRMG